MGELAPGPSRAKGVLLLGVVFVLGMVCGAALLYVGQRSIGLPPPPGLPPARPLDRLSRELDLDGDQRRAVRAILDEQREHLHQVLEASREAIRDVLRPDQQERFDDLRPPRPGGPEGFPGHPPPGLPPRMGNPPPGGGPPPRGAPPPPPDRAP